MNRTQKFAFFAPLVLIVLMYPFFHLLPKFLGDRLGWYLGLVIYWLIWGSVFYWWLLGGKRIRALVKP